MTRFTSGVVPALSNVEARSNTHDALVGLFHDDCDEAYVMVQNLGHPQADFPNKSADPSTFRLSFNFAGQAVDHSAILALDLDTGVVGERALSATGSETATLDVNLPAGGVFFFKYKSGRPFVQREQ